MRHNKQLAVLFTALFALLGVACEKEPATPTPEKPTIGIVEVNFEESTMTLEAVIVPSTNATAWYYKIEDGKTTEEYTKVNGSAGKPVTKTISYGVEYVISAYAENEAGKSEVVSTRYCAMPEDEVAITIGEVTLNQESMEAKATIYPSSNTKKWYWRGYNTELEADSIEWNVVEGNQEQLVKVAYEWGKNFVLEAYAECDAVVSQKTSADFMFEPSVPTITVSKPLFNEEDMTVSFEVTPSEDTFQWYYGPYGEVRPDSPEAFTWFSDNVARTVSFDVEYDIEYNFFFRAENALLKGNEEIIEFSVISPVVEIKVENLTSFSLDVAVTKKSHCVKYVAGAVHTSAYDRNIFIEQAQASLNPDPSYPFAVFNSATESRTFSEQDLVRNSLIDSQESAGLLLNVGQSYTIAVYGENEKGQYNVTTAEVVIPESQLDGELPIDIVVEDITETSAMATVTAESDCKVVVGYIDPEVAKADTENSFDFEGKSDEEIKAYIIKVANSIPLVYNSPITLQLCDYFAIGSKYVAYAIAIKDGKVGNVDFETFTTKRPTLTGEAKITAAEIVEQTSHETLTVILTPDAKASKVRLFAAPYNDYSAVADILDYVMDADDHQNYREEYDIDPETGLVTAVVDIYHPGDKYYIYASAIDSNGRAGEVVCVAQLAGLDTEYYTTIEAIIEQGNLNYNGTGTVDLAVTVLSENEDRISVSINTDTRSANASKVWLVRFSGKVNEIESTVKENFSEYPEKIYGSYKEAVVGTECRYEDTGSSFNPKIESLLVYDNSWGGDIIVAVVLDTSGKFNIHSYYAAGVGVTVL